MICRFIDSGFKTAYENMAIDETLSFCCKEPILRFYQWKPKAVSLGYTQKISDINIDFCKKNKIRVVRRITGGKAVFHDKELTYSFIVPEKTDLLPKEINESYRKIAHALILGLKKVGISAAIKEQPERITTPVCFNSSNWYELMVKGKKISGSAQRRIKGVILQHGSILVDFDSKINSEIFTTSMNKVRENLLNEKITSIKKEAEKMIPMLLIKNALKDGFKETFGFEFKKMMLSKKEVLLAEKLRKEKYQAEKWNFN